MTMVDFELICKFPWRFLKFLLFGYFWSVLKKMKNYGFEMHTEHAQKTKERIFFLVFAYSLMYTYMYKHTDIVLWHLFPCALILFTSVWPVFEIH